MKKFCLALLFSLTALLTCHGAQPSGTLPVLVIDTKNHQEITSKEKYVKGTYYLDPCGTAGVEAIGTRENPLPLQIKGRGNYTWWSFNKKPYRLKLDKKASLLGMNSSKHYALLAHADDTRAFMRNLTGFEVSRMAGLPWTPADQPCEVILNGDYIGLYFLTETIRFDKTRINLSNPDDAVEDWLAANPDKTADDYPFTEDDYSGAWLVELDNNPDEFQVTVPSRQREGAVIRVTYKSPEDYVTDAHREWLINEFDDIDSRIYADNNAEGAWLDKIDLTDAARFFVVNQIMCNYESYSGSCYLTKDKGDGKKWHFGPVWDFGSAFQPTRDMNKWIWESQYIQHWVKNMWNCQMFRDEVKRIFTEMDNEGFDRIINYQNEYAARITSAARNDAERWQTDGYGNPDMLTPLAEVQQQFRESINSFGYKLGVEGYTAPVVGNHDIYLRGNDYSNWDITAENKFTDLGNNIYELKLARLSGQFKLADADWDSVNYGGKEGDKLNVGESYKLMEKGRNLSLASGSAENVTLHLDLNKQELLILDSAGSELIVIDADTVVKYYNMQGIRVDNPIRGQIYIVKSGSKARKVIF